MIALCALLLNRQRVPPKNGYASSNTNRIKTSPPILGETKLVCHESSSSILGDCRLSATRGDVRRV